MDDEAGAPAALRGGAAGLGGIGGIGAARRKVE